MSGFVFITILLKLVHPAEGDCHVNNWPLSCEANFKVGPDKCEPCKAGKYGCNCSQDCTVNTYGLNCYFKCNCSVDELCDPAVGCVSFNITSTYKTFTQQTSVSAASPPPPSSSSSSDAQDTTPVLKNSAAPLTVFNVVIIALAASLVLVVTLSISCIVIVVSAVITTHRYMYSFLLYLSVDETRKGGQKQLRKQRTARRCLRPRNKIQISIRTLPSAKDPFVCMPMFTMTKRRKGRA
ncbi:uncharacterized protein LOC125663986 isoform X2 [Ostrea edulis]|uniref:uncharacterized protein LOC125663986 isoform X2 n=1 Tax=Ostrea edulis TaxID=37623 RepID=UPI0024AEF848|nr:uncharacterized protein LOC125663986 isoform X2 [Ostrea edulis]